MFVSCLVVPVFVHMESRFTKIHICVFVLIIFYLELHVSFFLLQEINVVNKMKVSS